MVDSEVCARLREMLGGELEGGMRTTAGAFIHSGRYYREALALGADPDPRIAFRASWGLECAYFLEPEAFLPHAGELVRRFAATANPSARRHYAKMLSDLLRRRGYRLAAADTEAVVEVCFSLLIDERTLVAVKVWVMEILVDLAPAHDWIADELRHTLLAQIPAASPGLANHARKVLRRLDRAAGIEK